MRAVMLALGLALGATAAAAEAPLDGEWMALSAERNGASAPDVIGHRLRIEGDGFRIIGLDGALVYGGTFAVDPSATPATIDFDNAEGIAAGTDWAGIWKLDGDTLTIVDNAADPTRPRPPGFTAPVDSGYVMVLFHRGQ